MLCRKDGLPMISLVLGLGNIGPRYRGTRHNVGFDVLDKVADTLPVTGSGETRLYRWKTVRAGEREIPLAWPTTYMNRSGAAAVVLLQGLDLSPEQMLVVVDDFALPPGRLRLRHAGSDGGHNGLASIIEEVGTRDFPRLRLGIGPAPEGTDPADYVLSPFGEDEQQIRTDMTNTAAEAVIHSLAHPFDEAMSRYNANPA